MEAKKGLIPQYMRDFSCIGASCEDSCCTGWRIEVDRTTYTRYETDPTLQELRPYVQRSPQSAGDYHYAEMILKDEMTCPFLNGEKLCSIHLKMGEQHLPALCATFPRVINIVDGKYELSGSVSCPEIARLALLQPGGMSFTETEGLAVDRHIIRHIADPDQPKYRYEEKYLPETRKFAIQIVQNRAYELTERLLILGLFSKELHETIVRGESDKIPELTAHYSAFMESGEIRERLGSFSAAPAAQIERLRRIIDIRLFHGVWHKRYLQCLMQALSGIDYTNDILRERNVELYTEAYRVYYAPFMSRHGYILENYLVNTVFGNLFPRLHKRDVFEGYAMLLHQFALIRFHLIGMAGYHKEAFGIEHVMQLIQSFSKTFEHTPVHINRIVKKLKESGEYHMEHMALLIL